jgi:hypothetical protein
MISCRVRSPMVMSPWARQKLGSVCTSPDGKTSSPPSSSQPGDEDLSHYVGTCNAINESECVPGCESPLDPLRISHIGIPGESGGVCHRSGSR